MLSIGTPNEKLYKRRVKNELKKNRKRIRSAGASPLPERFINSNLKCSTPSLNLLVAFPSIASSPSSQTAYNNVGGVRWNVNQYKNVPPAPLVIAGPSGSGKSTLLKRLMNEFQDCFGFSISHTTRKPRQGEQHGREYYFVDTETFEESIRKDEFIEYTRFSNNYYGTSKKAVKDVQNSGKICILDVEIDGVKNLKKTDLNPRFVFIKPPSLETLEERLRSRGTETEESIRARLDRAIEELKFGEIEGMFDLIITNDDIEKAYSILREFIVEDVEALKKSRGM